MMIQENPFCVMKRFMGDHDPQQNQLQVMRESKVSFI
jgi:hypothetical protein